MATTTVQQEEQVEEEFELVVEHYRDEGQHVVLRVTQLVREEAPRTGPTVQLDIPLLKRV
jgi:hypothetical protein